jgi:hypothetical protein
MAKTGESQRVRARENHCRVETGEPGTCAWHFLGIGNWVLDTCQLPVSPIVCRKSIGRSPQKMPFALFGIFFEDKHIEMVEGDNLSQSFGKNARPFLRFATAGSVPQRYETALHNAEHRFQREVCFGARSCRMQWNPRDSPHSILQERKKKMTHVAERSHFLPILGKCRQALDRQACCRRMIADHL